jgi:hypothetical protein
MATTLTRTPSSSGNRKIWTFSTWLKRTQIGSTGHFFSATSSGSTFPTLEIAITSGGAFLVAEYNGSGYNVNLTSTSLYRDPNAWYHFVVAVDTTQATSSDRVKIYVNGTQITEFSTSTYYSQNLDTPVNNTYLHAIGRNATSGESATLESLLAHTHLIDGTAYDASAFGETDATTGIWKAKTAPSVTYGTNGFFLKFENSGSMGTDSSGNANNFTVNGTMTQTVDTPSNVFATLNPLDGGINGTFSNGNLQLATSSAGYSTTRATLGFSAGKWYWEAKLSSGTAADIGINTASTDIAYTNQFLGYPSTGYAYSSSGNKANNNTNTAYGASYTTNDIIGVAFDADSGTLTFYKNGVSQGTAFTGLTGDTYLPAVSDDSGSSACTWQMNFGNGYFGTTAVASGNADDNGLGIFEYAPPTGYLSICTKNINEQEYA